MSRKNANAGPDMFSFVAPEKKAKAKADPPVPQGTRVAQVCGLISGIPQSLATALKALEDVERRAAASDQSSGILPPMRAKRLTDIAAEIRAMLPELRHIELDVDGMVQEVVYGKGRKEPELI